MKTVGVETARENRLPGEGDEDNMHKACKCGLGDPCRVRSGCSGKCGGRRGGARWGKGGSQGLNLSLNPMELGHQAQGILS